jgi:hypothetical protein
MLAAVPEWTTALNFRRRADPTHRRPDLTPLKHLTGRILRATVATQALLVVDRRADLDPRVHMTPNSHSRPSEYAERVSTQAWLSPGVNDSLLK